MVKKTILGPLLCAGSLAAGLALVGCSAAPAPTPTATTTPPAEPAERPALGANQDLAAAGPSSEREGAPAAEGAQERPSKKVAEPADSSPPPPPPPEGAPPSWLNKAPAAYRAGDAAQYLPKDCKDRVVIDVGAIVGSNASDVRAVFEQALKAKGDPREEARVLKAIAVIADASADPITNWREIAVCASGREVVAIGMARDKPLEVPLLVQKVKIALGDAPGVVTREGDLSMLTSPDGEIVAQPAPQVFLISKDKEALFGGIKKKAGGPGFTAARGHLIFAKMSEVDVSVKQSGDRIDLIFTVHLRGGAADEAKKAPKEVTAKLEGKLKGVADKLKGTPLEPIGERFRAAKVSIRGADATITGTFQRSALLSTLKSLNPRELEGLIRSLK
jgi:hypothetical protein